MAKVCVIGIDGSGVLSKRAALAIKSSKAILASKRLSEVFAEYDGYDEVNEKFQVINGVDETIKFIREFSEAVSVIASGDPMFFGIGTRLAEAFPDADLEIFPALSSVQLAFARIKLPWHDAFFMSLHGSVKREWGIEDVPQLAERHSKLAILTGGENTPERIAGMLPDKAKVYVLEKLGYDDETVKEGSPDEISRMTFASPNLMVVVNETHGITFGLGEDEFIHEGGLITKDEVRAVALHKLRLPMKGVFWDIGAGSGSVSIEATRISPGLGIYSVEKDSERVQQMRQNCASLHAGGVNVVEGEAPSVLEGLPTPDRVFIGGAGRGLASVMEYVLGRMEGGVIVVNAITLESLAEAREKLSASGLKPEVSAISVSRGRRLEGREYMKAMNQIFLIKAVK